MRAPKEAEFGLVEVIYLKLAATKKPDGQSVFVFWDKKCLNYGQNWENGFLHGLQSAKVILLLLSMKVCSMYIILEDIWCYLS